MLLSPIFRAFQLIKGHTKCFSDILITIDHSTCSLWYLIQSALNQSALNQIQGRLKRVTFLFKADLKIFVQSEKSLRERAHFCPSSWTKKFSGFFQMWFSSSLSCACKADFFFRKTLVQLLLTSQQMLKYRACVDP